MTDDKWFDLNTERPETHVFIQWKGTDACLDFTCECGGHGHFDGDFAYAVKCRDCGAIYEMPMILFPRKVTAWDGCGPVTPHGDDE